MSDRRGFALLAALWLLVAFSIAGLALSASGRSRRLAAANLSEATAAQAAAAGGLDQLRQRLAMRLDAVAGSALDPWHGVDSVMPDTLALGAERVLVRAHDTGAALNLNRAGDEELRRLFMALRVDAGEADRLAQAIADWRDPDDLHRARGAERDAYLAAGARMLPRNGPFQSLAELLGVRGMSASLFERVRPHLTLLGSGQINVNLADRPVLLALPGMTEEAVAVLLRYRRQNRTVGLIADVQRDLSPAARRELAAALPTLLARTTTETREVEVNSEAWLPGSPVHVRLTGLLVRARSAVFYVWSRVE
ncbi:MAG TPA: hypothetical protein VEK83_10590 [Gemmatimonadales bacterium]|nr:hypothetical protein [Gemmatimonadales bacterium]